MADEREKMGPGETGDDREKLSDVEAHRFSEAEEKRDKIAAADEGDDVEGHMLRDKYSAGKNQA